MQGKNQFLVVGCLFTVKNANTKMDSHFHGNDRERSGNDREKNTDKFALGVVKYFRVGGSNLDP